MEKPPKSATSTGKIWAVLNVGNVLELERCTLAIREALGRLSFHSQPKWDRLVYDRWKQEARFEGDVTDRFSENRDCELALREATCEFVQSLLKSVVQELETAGKNVRFRRAAIARYIANALVTDSDIAPLSVASGVVVQISSDTVILPNVACEPMPPKQFAVSHNEAHRQLARPIRPGRVTIVVPAAGRSSRFPGMKPKWMLTQPNGRLMIVDALCALDFTNVDRIVIAVLQFHIDKYCGGSVEGIFKAFEDGTKQLAQLPLSIVVLGEETKDQMETIQRLVEYGQVHGPIFIKDCDNQFALTPVPEDSIALLKMERNNEDSVSNVASKGYVQVDERDLTIINLAEKLILSPYFCAGGYGWTSSERFLRLASQARQICSTFELESQTELAVSDVYFLSLLLDRSKVRGLLSSSYQDWGTAVCWKKYCNGFRTLFVDIDGTLMENSGQYFPPLWGSTKGIVANCAYLRRLHATGRVFLVLTTSRRESFRAATTRQLSDYNVTYDQLLMGLPHCQRVLINDFAPTNGYPSASAVNLVRNANNLEAMLDL